MLKPPTQPAAAGAASVTSRECVVSPEGNRKKKIAATGWGALLAWNKGGRGASHGPIFG